MILESKTKFQPKVIVFKRGARDPGRNGPFVVPANAGTQYSIRVGITGFPLEFSRAKAGPGMTPGEVSMS